MPVKGPLTGIRVLDMSQAHAGPFGSQVLGDMGAEVIKIESPLGDLLRMGAEKKKAGADVMLEMRGGGYYLLALNRNKKGLMLDWYTPAGKQAFFDLVKISDIVYDNFRAGVMERLGFDYDSLKKINPKIISCSITGFGRSGPYANEPSFDDKAQGIAGMYSLCGEMGGPPMRSPVAIADISSGMFAAMAVGFALYGREQTGEGRRLDINLLDSSMALMATHYGYLFEFNQVPMPQGTKHPLTAMLGVFRTKNGHITVGPCWPRICRVINKEWLIEDERFKDPVFNRMINKKALEEEIEDGLMQADTEDWLELAKAEDLPFGPVYTLDKTLQDPQVLHNKTEITLDHPEYGTIRAIDCAIEMSGIEGEYTAPPLCGQDNDYVFKELLGYSDDQIAQIQKEQEDNWEQMKLHVHKETG
ncbi:MAG: CoA transferase [Chloroflexota bacterium]|nr:CoA transferase [Chloroflexota bacterium]